MKVRKSRSLISPVTRKVLALLYPEVFPADYAVLREEFARGDRALLTDLRREGLTPMVNKLVHCQDLQTEVAPLFLTQLLQDYACSLKTAVCQEQEAFQVLEVLTAAGVDFIVLKGADLRWRLYRDPAVRPMADLDILLPRDQLGLAQDALEKIDYQLFSIGPRRNFQILFDNEIKYWRPPGHGLALDIHWELRAVAWFYRLPYSFIKNQTMRFNHKNLWINLLQPELMISYLCLNAVSDFIELKNYFMGKDIIDIIMYINYNRIEWLKVLDIINKLKIQWPLLIILEELAHIMPHLIPTNILFKLQNYRPSIIENYLFSHRLTSFSQHMTIVYHHPVKDWLWYAFAKLWPSPEYLEKMFSASRAQYWRQFLNKLLKHKGNDRRED